MPGKCRSSLSGEGTGGRTAGPFGIRTVPSKAGSSSSAPTQMRPLSHTHHSSSLICAVRLGYIPVLEPEQGGTGLMLPETGRSSILTQRWSQSQRAFGLKVQRTNHPLPREGEMSSEERKINTDHLLPYVQASPTPTSSLEPGSLSDHFLLSLPSGKS